MAGFGIAFVLLLSFAGIMDETIYRFDTYYGCRAAQAMLNKEWEEEAPIVRAKCFVRSLPQSRNVSEKATPTRD